jgi:hypothetical protein
MIYHIIIERLKPRNVNSGEHETGEWLSAGDTGIVNGF